jgi:hypothetical protein
MGYRQGGQATVKHTVIDNRTEINRLEAENARLKDEVERLTKAGDAMVSFLWMENDDDNCNGGITYIAEKAERDWNAAKEGKQAK